MRPSSTRTQVRIKTASHSTRHYKLGLPVKLTFACSWLFLAAIIEVVIAPPSLFLLAVKDHLKEDNDQTVSVAAQNGYHEKFGAFTGEISCVQVPHLHYSWLTGSRFPCLLFYADSISLRMPRFLGSFSATLNDELFSTRPTRK